MAIHEKREIVRTLFRVRSNSLHTVILKVGDKFYLCEVGGPDAMKDIGPFKTIDHAVGVAKFRTSEEVFVSSSFADSARLDFAGFAMRMSTPVVRVWLQIELHEEDPLNPKLILCKGDW